MDIPQTAELGGVPVTDIPVEFQRRAVAQNSDVPQHIDFFDVLEEYLCEFPDGIQYVSIKVMNEGDRRRYLNKTNREVRMNAQTREMKMRSAAGDDKHELLKIVINGWNVFRGGKPLPFTQSNVQAALDAWPPTLIDLIEKKVTEVNPWLKGTEDNLDVMKDEYNDLGLRIAALEDKAAKN